MPSKKERKLSRQRLVATPEHISGGEAEEEVGVVTMFASLFESEPYCIYLINTKRTFHVNVAPLLAGSAYFRALISSSLDWKEQRERRTELSLPVIQEDAFGSVIEYLYTSSYDPDLPDDLFDRCKTYLATYLLADRLMINSLKPMAMSKMKAALHNYYASTMSPVDLEVLIDLAYSSSASDGDDEVIPEQAGSPRSSDESKGSTTTFPNDEAPPDPRRDMQLLIASYTASHLAYYKKHQCIKDLLRRGGDFVLDVVERT